MAEVRRSGMVREEVCRWEERRNTVLVERVSTARLTMCWWWSCRAEWLRTICSNQISISIQYTPPHFLPRSIMNRIQIEFPPGPEYRNSGPAD